MIKHYGDLNKAIAELKSNNNNAVSFVYENASINEGEWKGVVVTLKDLFATQDAATQASSKILDGFTPRYDATIVSKLRKAGASIVGKTHMDELALGGTGMLSAYGVIANPLDKSRMVGGSSSGAAATLTDSISIALGSDTGDSVRLPASYIGKVGFKPSYGAVSRFGMFPFASSLDTVGWFAHNVNDIIATANVLFGKDEKDMTSREVAVPTVEVVKPRRVAVLKDTNKVLSSSIAKDFNSFKDLLSKDGVEVVEVEIKQELLDAIDITYSVIAFSEASSNDANLNGVAFGQRRDGKDWSEVMTNTRSEGFGPMVQRRFSLGAFFLSTENQVEIFQRAQKVRRLIVDAFENVYSDFDLLIFPAASVAPKLTEAKPDNWHSSYLTHANFAGTPSLSLPWTKEDGMPVNLSLDGRRYSDKELLSYALYIEKLLGGAHE